MAPIYLCIFVQMKLHSVVLSPPSSEILRPNPRRLLTPRRMLGPGHPGAARRSSRASPSPPSPASSPRCSSARLLVEVVSGGGPPGGGAPASDPGPGDAAPRGGGDRSPGQRSPRCRRQPHRSAHRREERDGRASRTPRRRVTPTSRVGRWSWGHVSWMRRCGTPASRRSASPEWWCRWPGRSRRRSTWHLSASVRRAGRGRERRQPRCPRRSPPSVPAASWTASCTSCSATVSAPAWSSTDGFTAGPRASPASWPTCRSASRRTGRSASAEGGDAWPRSWAPPSTSSCGARTPGASACPRSSRWRRTGSPGCAGPSPISGAPWAGPSPTSAPCSIPRRW